MEASGRVIRGVEIRGGGIRASAIRTGEITGGEISGREIRAGVIWGGKIRVWRSWGVGPGPLTRRLVRLRLEGSGDRDQGWRDQGYLCLMQGSMVCV